MDIGTLKTSEREVEITNPGNDQPLGIRVSLVSIDDDSLKQLRRRITDRRIKLEQRGKAFTAEDIEDNQTELALTVLKGWTWGIGSDGEKATFHDKVPEFNRANVLAVFNELPWFQRQVLIASGSEQDFFELSKPS